MSPVCTLRSPSCSLHPAISGVFFPGNLSHLQLLNTAFQRTPNPSDLAASGARQLVLLLGLRLAARAVKVLEDDEDDLFYETGRSTQEMMQALVRNTFFCFVCSLRI